MKLAKHANSRAFVQNTTRLAFATRITRAVFALAIAGAVFASLVKSGVGGRYDTMQSRRHDEESSQHVTWIALVSSPSRVGHSTVVQSRTGRERS
jgi:hypothetical protein